LSSIFNKLNKITTIYSYIVVIYNITTICSNANLVNPQRFWCNILDKRFHLWSGS